FCPLTSFDFRYLNLQVESESIYESMNEEKDHERSALDEVMVARIEIEGIGVAANEKEMTDSVRALPGVREVKIENGVMYVTYDPLDTAEKKIEEAVRASGNTVKAATTDTESPHPGTNWNGHRSRKVLDSSAAKATVAFLTLNSYFLIIIR